MPLVRRENQTGPTDIQKTLSKAFNAVCRARIVKGDKAVFAMPTPGNLTIVPMTVKEHNVEGGYAILHNGSPDAIYGVIIEEDENAR